MRSLTRRRLLQSGAAGLMYAAAAPYLARATEAAHFQLAAAAADAPLVVPQGPPTRAWLYNGEAPGPVLRARQGDTLIVDMENRLDEPTTVHWHGLRVPNAMDGVPHFSQTPIAPGESFRYSLPLNDAGTFWYHPHINSSEQLGRGLRGMLIVEEPEDVAESLGADRDIPWALEDWRLDENAQIAPFGGMHDAAHGGRFGNVVTLNGAIRDRIEAAPGERLRLRIANLANALSFRLDFGDAAAWVIALDGHPIAPREIGSDGVWIGAGQRADVILDMPLSPGAEVPVTDTAYGADYAYRLTTLTTSSAKPLRAAERPAPPALPTNPIPLPDLGSAQLHELRLEGGMMGSMRSGMMGGRMMGMREMMLEGRVWALNGVAAAAEMASMEPLFSFGQGRSQIVTIINDTAWHHPMHLHGHSFRVLGPRAQNMSASDLARTPVRDTVLLAPGEQVAVAFVADNPGDWMLHCHILEHQEAGMMAVARVA